MTWCEYLDKEAGYACMRKERLCSAWVLWCMCVEPETSKVAEFCRDERNKEMWGK